MSSSILQTVFQGIPSTRILEIASSTLRDLESGSIQPETKDGDELVCRADREIQEFLLDYFLTSAMAGRYSVRAEELTAGVSELDSAEWLLILDPLDGTSSFCRNLPTWGTMAAICNWSGELKYSWCLLSDGTTFSSSGRSRGNPNSPPRAWSSTARSALRFDVFDYGAGQTAGFAEALGQRWNISPAQVEISSEPSAVWAAWGLASGERDGLLWLPSHLGKKYYPDYDLAFLDCLSQEGWEIALGKSGEEVGLLAVAPDKRSLEVLLDTAMAICSAARTLEIQSGAPLRITAPARGNRS